MKVNSTCLETSQDLVIDGRNQIPGGPVGNTQIMNQKQIAIQMTGDERQKLSLKLVERLDRFQLADRV